MSTPAKQTAVAVPSNSVFSAWRDHPVAMVVTAFAAAAVVGGLAYVASLLLADTGDEPPIRVKNGSLELQLLATHKSWAQDGSNDKWKISAGTRKKEPLDVIVAYTAGATCSSQTASGKIVRITYSDLTYIDLEAKNKTTKVTIGPSSKQLTRVSEQLLTYGTAGAGYINGIVVDSVPLCAFTEAKQLTHVVILDY
jgi:hypothetical protein